MMTLQTIIMWLAQALPFLLGIGGAGLAAPLGGPPHRRCLQRRRADPERHHLPCGSGTARRLAAQPPALGLIAGRAG